MSAFESYGWVGAIDFLIRNVAFQMILFSQLFGMFQNGQLEMPNLQVVLWKI